ncbi:GIY-YIG nuclease family protein [Rhizobium mesoamericanum]|uniref:Bacteriophage T5 Orf172 DNA-binding domain-containing protein n=1 Tax=Rhizobium mesoamericanum STM3625 TaxID=1211777 RepID=K0PZW8_9HYPH|nr:GIY-YIG nuclease family protein [Rhizobium mesoamericanum]CCM77102.1 hypothetical protein BN77_4148 [Rhizobium mesoamericanum STM3625]
MSGYVYFIKPVGQAGPIKIGHSEYPPYRLASLQTWSPVELEVVSRVEGTRELEKAIHERFAHCHLRGEWFSPDEELVALAEGVRDGRKIEDLIDLKAKTGKLFRRPNTKSPVAKIVGTYKLRVERARQRGGALRGKHMDLSDEVRAILNSAGGYRQDYRELTQDEISTLEAFIEECRNYRKVAA